MLITLTSIGYGDGVSMPEIPYNDERIVEVGRYFGDDVFLFTLYMTLNMCAYAYFQGRLADTVTTFVDEKRKTPESVEDDMMD